ncbi:hypothetical protein [Streptomyces sp. TLI_146]|uniref:hypothetical protein n=1 Tax=Streptomyces sp. TLI_146 TaxID=1938858 RepID=UPI000C703672|nr:hypothetical protein [Streptomyces sp. TLI_146]PKV82890.1 hypothetical protein BX283_0355 [Streptomyces sp. TLI_146]
MSFLEATRVGAGLLLIVGVPTLLVAMTAVSAHRRMDVVRFRFLLAMPLSVFARPLIASSAPEPLAFQVMAQIAFAALVPAPLLPEDWVGESVRPAGSGW